MQQRYTLVLYDAPMPVEVNVEARLKEIAEATVAVSESRGAGGITIRAVAEKVGGSTTLITNYLPTRSALLRNAIEHAITAWDAEGNEVIDSTRSEDRFRALSLWSCSTADNDLLLRRLFIEVVSGAESSTELADVVRDEAHRHRAELGETATEANVADPELAADLMYLVLRGFYMATLEDADQWTSERVSPLVERLLAFLEAETSSQSDGRARAKTAPDTAA